jgi:hypothetical protein
LFSLLHSQPIEQKQTQLEILFEQQQVIMSELSKSKTNARQSAQSFMTEYKKYKDLTEQNKKKYQEILAEVNQ